MIANSTVWCLDGLCSESKTAQAVAVYSEQIRVKSEGNFVHAEELSYGKIPELSALMMLNRSKLLIKIAEIGCLRLQK
jgi:hypothetical protein